MKLVRLLNLIVLALLITTLATPSLAASRSRDNSKKETAKAAPLFPDAKREDPKPKPNSRLVKDLNKLVDASQGDDQTLAKKLAADMLANTRAGKYEQALAHQVMAFALLEEEDYPNAIQHLEQLVATDVMPNDTHFQAMLQLAQLHYQEDRHEDALKWMDRFINESATKKAEHFALKANMLYRADRFQETIDAMNQALALTDKPQASWLQFLMASYFELGNVDEAVRIANQLLEKTPNDESMMRNLASIYVQADQHDKAIDVLTAGQARGLLQEERDYKQLYQLYHYTEKEQQAIDTIQAGLDKGILKPSAELYQALAEANYFSDKVPEAIAAYQKAAPLAATGEVSMNLARLLTNEERFAEAKAAIQQALAKGLKKPGDAYVLLGSVEYGLNNRAGQIAAYKEATKYPETKQSAEDWLKKAGVK